MTKDNGMDVTPSWDELRKSVDILRSMGDALQKERDALAAHVERLHSTLEPFARAWQQREPVGDHNSKGYQRRLERALLPFYSTGNVDEFSLTGEHLRDAARALSAPVGTTSLAHRDAEKQAEALDKLRRGLLRNSSAFVLKTLEVEASKLRRQAEEDSP